MSRRFLDSATSCRSWKYGIILRKVKRISIVIAALVAVCAAVWLFHSGDRLPAEQPENPVQRRSAQSARVPRKAIPKKERAKRSPSVRRAKPVIKIVEPDDEEELAPADKALAERIEKALEEEDFKAAAACAVEAQSSGAVSVRKAMVDALGWFGDKAIPELTPFLADADQDVREDAMNEWSVAVSSVEDDAEKIGLVECAMQVLSDEDVLEDISGEYIGIDEKLAVESLLRVIEGGNANGVAKAKETYEFVTGEEFAGREAAEKWLAEEYVPPEAEEETVQEDAD